MFGTLHANNAAQTIQRILDLFPQEERTRQTFALTIRAVISQQLCRVLSRSTAYPAVEILIRTPIIRKLIAENAKAIFRRQFGRVRARYAGFHRQPVQAVTEEWIDLKPCAAIRPNQEELKMALKGIRTATSGIL